MYEMDKYPIPGDSSYVTKQQMLNWNVDINSGVKEMTARDSTPVAKQYRTSRRTFGFLHGLRDGSSECLISFMEDVSRTNNSVCFLVI